MQRTREAISRGPKASYLSMARGRHSHSISLVQGSRRWTGSWPTWRKWTQKMCVRARRARYSARRRKMNQTLFWLSIVDF